MCPMLDQFLWGHSSRVCDISWFFCHHAFHRGPYECISQRAVRTHFTEGRTNAFHRGPYERISQRAVRTHFTESRRNAFHRGPYERISQRAVRTHFTEGRTNAFHRGPYERISQRAVRTSREKQLDPKGSNCFSREVCSSISKKSI